MIATEPTANGVVNAMAEGMKALGTDRLYAKVDIDKLLIDDRYQREIREDRVRRIVAEFDERLLGVLTCSVRDDGIFVIDGQHRLAALKQKGITTAQCELRAGLTVEQEAWMFYHLDTDRMGLSGDNAFRALLAAQDETALEIKDAIQAAGMEVRFHGHGQNTVRSYKTLLTMAYDKRHGMDVVREVLNVVGQAWPNTPNAAASAIVRGLAIFLEAYPEVDRRELSRKLSEHSSPVHIVRAGRGIRESLSSGGETAMAKAILGVYNIRRTTGRLEDRIK